jgi:hypothetical protein
MINACITLLNAIQKTPKGGTEEIVMVRVASLTLTPLERQPRPLSTNLSLSFTLATQTYSCIAQQVLSK